MSADFGRCHFAVDFCLIAAEAMGLAFAGLHDLLAHLHATGAGRGIRKFAERDRRDLDMDVDAVQERAADAAEIAFDLQRRAIALPFGIAPVSAGAGVHGRHEHQTGGKSDAAQRAGNGDTVFLEGLAEDFERAAIEFRQFVQKKDPVVGEADLAGGRRAAPAVR